MRDTANICICSNFLVRIVVRAGSRTTMLPNRVPQCCFFEKKRNCATNAYKYTLMLIFIRIFMKTIVTKPQISLIFDRRKVCKSGRSGTVEIVVYYNCQRVRTSTGISVMRNQWKKGCIVKHEDCAALCHSMWQRDFWRDLMSLSMAAWWRCRSLASHRAKAQKNIRIMARYIRRN